MTQTKWNYLIDGILFAMFVGMVGIGILLAWAMPTGPTALAADKFLWGLHRHQWGDIHLVLSLAFVVFLGMHLVLHWKWIGTCTQRFLKSAWSMSLWLFLPAIVLFLAWAIERPNAKAYIHHGHGQHESEEAKQDIHSATVANSHQNKPRQKSRQESRQESRQYRHEHHDDFINGRISLNDIQRRTGVSASALAIKLGLDPSRVKNQRLGHLRKRYGFSMQDLREHVNELLKTR